jgi:hypothetical protein
MRKLKFVLALIGGLLVSSAYAGEGHHHGVPLPVLGVGLPSLAAAGIGYLLLRRRRHTD